MSDMNYSGSMPPPPGGGQKSNATMVLVIAILGIVCCQLCGPIAWYMANKQLAAGVAPSEEGMFKASKIMGIIGTVLFGLSLIWMAFGGFAIISAMLSGGGVPQ